MAAPFSINTYDTSGDPLYLEIEGDKITRVEKSHRGTAQLNLKDQVVLPPLIDAHNHPAPYNLSNSENLLGGQWACIGFFRSRFDWNPLWRGKSDEIMKKQALLRAAHPQEADCWILEYTTMLDVGAAVIQGFDPEYFRSCAPLGGEALGRVRDQTRESPWVWKPTDYHDGKTLRRSKEARELAQGNPMVVHLAEGKAGNPQIQSEIEFAYYAQVLGREGGVYIHGTGFSETDLEVIRQTHGTIIWSPVSQTTLYGPDGTLDVPKIMAKGIRIGLGSDWALTGSPNILREMAAAQAVLERKFGYEKEPETAARMVLRMATVNNAEALGLTDYSGIRTGGVASLTFVSKKEILPRGRLDLKRLDESDVGLVLQRGRAVFGDTKTMGRMRADANPLPLSETCRRRGVSKSVAKRPDGSPFQRVHNGLQKFFPEIPDIVQCR